MSVVPVFPIDNGATPGGSYRVFGEGREGFEIQAQPGRELAGFKSRRVVLAGSAPAIIGIAEINSTLSGLREGVDGVGMLVRAFNRDGDGVISVWDNDIANDRLIANVASPWVSELPAGWGRVSISAKLPPGLRANYLDIGFVVRAQGGSCQFNTADFRDHFQLLYKSRLSGRYDRILDNNRSLLAPGIFERADSVRAAAFDSKIVSIAQGQTFQARSVMHIERSDVRTSQSSGVGIHNQVALALRMHRASGGFDWYPVSEIATSPGDDAPVRSTRGRIRSRSIGSTTSHVARNAYRQYDACVCVVPIERGVTPRSIIVEHGNIDLDVLTSVQAESGAS